ncbi:hypothetical protein [Streptomyces sp. NPDC018693]|uniref:hypothetical protein n=1 Tax=unclassified Streptomyces TaxID=2593676 RepID=UPI0037A4C022
MTGKETGREPREVAVMSDATTTDLYEVTMAMPYLREGMTGPATFSLFVRDPPREARGTFGYSTVL